MHQKGAAPRCSALFPNASPRASFTRLVRHRSLLVGKIQPQILYGSGDSMRYLCVTCLLLLPLGANAQRSGAVPICSRILAELGAKCTIEVRNIAETAIESDI